jgi:hypothetical protein
MLQQTNFRLYSFPELRLHYYYYYFGENLGGLGGAVGGNGLWRASIKGRQTKSSWAAGTGRRADYGVRIPIWKPKFPLVIGSFNPAHEQSIKNNVSGNILDNISGN